MRKSDDTGNSGGALLAKRIGPFLFPDRTRVLLRPFSAGSKALTRKIIARILALTEQQAAAELEQVLSEFSDRHHDVKRLLKKRFAQIREYAGFETGVSKKMELLIGAYFSHEYSPESTALFNPSIVIHPDRKDVPEGSLRFLLSLRAVGEGHISSVTFRTGLISARNRVTLVPPGQFVSEPETVPNLIYEKDLFYRKLEEAGLHSSFCRRVVDSLPEKFSLAHLYQALDAERRKMKRVDAIADRAIHGMLLLAKSNYEVCFKKDSTVSQRVIFPSGPTQSNGIEDARFVCFRDDDGDCTYYATYTAYDGKITLPQLLETKDFLKFKFITLNGPAVQNKGMALFPKKIGGRYAMLSRQDDENILLMYSDNIHFWQTPQILLKPKYPWEFIKIGTCGSPIETDAGWLVLSHGVGPMRKYCIGAFLLDLENPAKVIGRLPEPLISPNEAEREGYVPNVVYTCGAILHGKELIIPYAVSDYSTSFASVNLKDLLGAMV